MFVFRKALESLASRGVDDGREKMQRKMDSLREAFSARIQELAEVNQPYNVYNKCLGMCPLSLVIAFPFTQVSASRPRGAGKHGHHC